MSTTHQSIFALLAKANQELAIFLPLADGTLIPLGKWLVGELKQIGNDKGTMTYSAVITADAAELEAIRSAAVGDLEAVNEELTRLGAPTLTIPPKPAPDAPAEG